MTAFPNGATAALSMANSIEAEGLRQAVTGIRELHRPAVVCMDCGYEIDIDDETCGCDHDDRSGDTTTICAECCITDSVGGRRNYCRDWHDHDPGQPICRTVDRLDRAGV